MPLELARHFRSGSNSDLGPRLSLDRRTLAGYEDAPGLGRALLVQSPNRYWR